MVNVSCFEYRTRHCGPLLVDMKIHFAPLRLCYGAAYAPWNVPQFLLGFPLVLVSGIITRSQVLR